ncbi:unnamed protein product [Euphydryas editha]|uniref:Uncharacterized protein n=1 Tax=Euphydryas editha TaxID=104508 RepID=A0AAU9TTA0_EUPED|nr:unnamed protein product [Euphydryas editha]
MFCELPEFGRCCFCMPLRRGILVFGYLNILFFTIMIGLYSYSIQHNGDFVLLYHGGMIAVDDEICVAMYCADVIFNILLVYGAHRKIMSYLRIFYYYSITTIVASLLVEVLSWISSYMAIELLPVIFISLSLNLYLIFLVRSLLKKMETSGHTYENQLHQFINGECKVDVNGVYPSTVIPNETA